MCAGDWVYEVLLVDHSFVNEANFLQSSVRFPLIRMNDCSWRYFFLYNGPQSLPVPLVNLQEKQGL